jgi:hypothetical protein
MISIDDVIGMTDLTAEEVDAIAEHEHLTETAAAALGDYLLHRHKGAQAIQQMICEDIREALHKGEADHARHLFAALRHFMAEHPEAARGAL